MTYGTPHTLLRRPTPLPPMPERAKPAPTMTWAEMARAEGHRPGHAQTRYDAKVEREAAHDAKVRAALLHFPDGATVNKIRRETWQQPGTVIDALDRLADAGDVALWFVDLPGHPGTRHAALTDAGRAKAEAAR